MFVFIYDDIDERPFESPSGRRGQQPTLPGHLRLEAVLGASRETLLSLRPRGEEAPLFVDRTFESWHSDTRLTTVQVASILHHHDFPVVAFNASALGGDPPPSLPEPAQVLCAGISTTLTMSPYGLNRVIATTRRLLPGVPIVVGGAGISLNPDWFATCDAEFCMMGSAEVALPEFVRSLRAGCGFDSVPNLRWKTSGGLVRTSAITAPIDMDGIPTPRYDLLREDRSWPPVVFYESIRGCPFRCGFCSYPQQAAGWHVKSAERMADEFCYYASRGVEWIACYDSTFLAPLPRARKFCDLLIRRGAPISWECYGHAAQLRSQTLCEQLAAAGCRRVFIGMESGDDRILANMNKHTTREGGVAAVRNVKRAGILVHTSFIIGFPGETIETAQNTFSFIDEAQPDFFSFQIFQVRDKQIPILAEAERYGLTVHYDDNGQYAGFTHADMDSGTAMGLLEGFFDGYECGKPGTRIEVLPHLNGIDYNLTAPRRIHYVRDKVYPIFAAYEQFMAHHHDRPAGFPRAPTSLLAVSLHKTRARRLFNEELESGRLIQSHM